jgi:protein O-GlcNAc transferase
VTSVTTELSEQEAFSRALTALQSEKFDDAARLFDTVLQAQPKHVAALNLLGITHTQRGSFGDAEIYLQRALQEQPKSDATLYNYGLVLKALRRPAEALQRFSEALALNPSAAETWNNRGTVLNDLKRYGEANDDFDKAIALQPHYAEAFCNKAKTLAILGQMNPALSAFERAAAINPSLAEAWLGSANIDYDLKQYDKALTAYDKALSLKSGLWEAWVGRGNILCELKRPDEALVAYDKALALEPSHAAVHGNRAAALLTLKRHSEALVSCERAVALQPALPFAHINHAAALLSLSRYPEALVSCDRTIALEPGLAAAHCNRAAALLGLSRYAEALTSSDHAIRLDPEYAKAHKNHGAALLLLSDYSKAFDACDKAFAIDPDLEYLEGNRLYAKQITCNWDGLDTDAAHLVSAVRNSRPAADPFYLLATPSSPADQLHCAELYVRNRPLFPPLWHGEVYSHERIRIAYLSADFHEHATAYLMAGLFEHHDESRFEITAISFGPDDNSRVRQRIKGACEHFLDVRNIGDQELAELLRRREIDIAVDLKGFTANNRLDVLSRRPAPIQVNYLGYPGTMGAPCFDYILADSTVIPEDQLAFYSEKVAWLPDSYQVNDDKRLIAEHIPSRLDCGLPKDGFVYCCFNNPFKLNPNMFDIWMRLLEATEGSVLWLFEGTSSSCADVCRENLHREAEKRGIPRDRLIFAAKTNLADHLARHRLADLFLDTLPYNAHTTASDALWAGLPVVTCLGSTFAGRVSASLLNAVGLSELIANSVKDYETLALKFAREPALLAATKTQLARNRELCPLFDTRRFSRHIESAYHAMLQAYRDGRRPASFAVGSAPMTVDEYAHGQ